MPTIDKGLMVGGTEITDLYLGSVQVLSACVGTECVWSNAQPDNEIWYVPNINTAITLLNQTGWGANIVSHTYSNGKGVIRFDGPVTSIPASGFASEYNAKNGVESISLPDTISGIGVDAFKNSHLLELSIPTGVTAIPNYMCYSAINLTAVTIPDGVATIGQEAFSKCFKLKSVNIPSSVTSIAQYAFFDCRTLSSVTVDQSNPTYDSRNNCNAIIETSTNKLLFASNSTTAVPSTVVSIDNLAFYGLYTITSITIPDSVSWIGYSAFMHSTNLQSVTIGSGLTNIYSRAFDCQKLKEINISAPTAPTLANANVFSGVPSFGTVKHNFGKDYSSWKANQYISGWMFSDRLEEIPSNEIWYTTTNSATTAPTKSGSTDLWGSSTHYQSTEYTNGKGIMHFDGNVGYVPSSGFNGKGTLKNIALPDTVWKLESQAFRNCTGLSYIDLPDRISTMNSGTFSGCSNMESMNISSSLTAISDSMVNGCTNLKSVIFKGWRASIPASSFANTKLEYVNFPKINWISGDNACNRAFYNCSALTTVKMPYLLSISGTSAMAQAFYGASAISAYMPNLSGIYGLRSTEFLFQKSKVSAVSFPSLTTVSGDYALNLWFYNSTTLRSINFPKLSAISGNDVFYEFMNGPASYIQSATIHPNTVAVTGYNNILWYGGNSPFFTALTYLRFSENAYSDVHLEKLYALDHDSVLNVLNHLGSNSIYFHATATFHYSGLTVTDDANGNLTKAYNTAVGKGWTIQNLTITPYS